MSTGPLMEVRFDVFCQSCKHYKKEGYEDPCNECLEYPMLANTAKPLNYDSVFKNK